MHLVVAKVDEQVFNGEAESVTVPGTAGEMTILGHHEPLISTLKKGEVVVRSSEGEKKIAIEGGVIEVRSDGATIIL